jgi:hypothetical protein
MASSQELFRFAATRRPDRAVMSQIAGLLILDERAPRAGSLRSELFGPGEFGPKLATANAYAHSADFLDVDSPAIVALEPFVAYLREALTPGVPVGDLVAAIEDGFPVLAAILRELSPDRADEAIDAAMFVIWDSVYAQTIRGCDRYVTTNHLIDALRAYHVLGLLVAARSVDEETWPGGAFDDYDALIDLKAAAEGADGEARAAAAAVTAASAFAPAGRFRVPLSVGAIKPPVVGDLLLVQQTLRRYELGELGRLESIMRGERRELTLRNLARSSQTTTTESLLEQEQSSSVKTDERFRLATEAQQSAEQSLGVQAGISVSGKFGPVQVAASVNASFNTSKSSSDSTSQEYAKTVTEEASQSVRSSIKESSSLTVLTESEDTSLRGWNNEGGTTNVNGLYRWVDAVYDASLQNYGRRLMLSLNVPEPSAFYNGLLEQREAAATADLEEPMPPARISPSSMSVLEEGSTDGFESYQDLDELNYARLAARYDVPVEPPPGQYLTGSKTIVHPDAMQAIKVDEHTHGSDLSLVMSDSTLTLDPGYRLTQVGVLAAVGEKGGLDNFVDALKLGDDEAKLEDANVILVQVAGMSFHLETYKDPKDGKKKVIHSNFNTYQPIPLVHPPEVAPFADAIQPSIPITVTANFEGMLALTVAYQAERTPAALDSWKSATYAAIVKGYTAKRQAYEQSLTLATAKAQDGTQAQTFALREDQYRAIELTELKRGCIDLLTEGTAAGHTSIAIEEDGTPRIVVDEAEGALHEGWRAPLPNGSVAEFFELAFEWESTVYQLYPYYWAGAQRWADLAQAQGADPIFETFLRAGSASVVVPVRPGYERSVMFFLKTGDIWGGGYLALFNDQDMLDVYVDVERGRQFDPPLQVGESWTITLPTSMVMLQADETLPEFPPEVEVEVARAAPAMLTGAHAGPNGGV